jgi:YD repeat-containing protein
LNRPVLVLDTDGTTTRYVYADNTVTVTEAQGQPEQRVTTYLRGR